MPLGASGSQVPEITGTVLPGLINELAALRGTGSSRA